MIIGVPKEIKVHEYRVGLTPAGVKEITGAGHTVLIQKDAASGIGISDEDYQKVGGKIVPTAEEIFKTADMIVKVKEPQASECKQLRPGQLLFTYLHLAPDPEQTKLLLESGCTAIAYETVTDRNGRLPLLAPMSEVAGRMSIQAGAVCLEKKNDGRGTLLSGVPGVLPGRVTVLGGGVVGYNAAKMAVGIGADVTIMDVSLHRLNELDMIFDSRVKTLVSNTQNIEECVCHSDLVIGAVLIPGANAPKLVKKGMLKHMLKGSVVVDVAIDQGGCFETSRPTTHSEPTFIIDDVVHYCVANMPGGVARTSTFALNNATIPYTLRLIREGWRQALKNDAGFANGLNIHEGKVTHPGVSESLGYPLHKLSSIL
ncbi:hypothetical protein CHS0354_035284 [Potamilus streckersoni]|uniref:alanine dehydrogenase n=1 Tax=Potamilus streckersoni TaxID=2493646 RepID=A0AAE0VMZ0_9BIVA|nr:hypothetical protein CHS0354_035284 [Potamilus streckersoni]